MPDERICSVCGRTNPIDQPRCINCGQRAQGVMLVAEKPATTSSWWSGSEQTRAGSIPAPPQVREEAERAETARVDQERRRVERERRLQAAKERDERLRAERKGAPANEESAVSRLYFETVGANSIGAETSTAAPTKVVAMQVDCPRCGVPLETTGNGQGFSFCLRCGNTVDETHAAALPVTSAITPVEQLAHEKNAAGVHAAQAGVNTATRRVAIASTVSVAEPVAVGVSPGLAAVMSFFLPGVGQLVNGQVAKAALLFLAMFVMIATFHLSPFAFIALAARGLSAIDAYRIAERRRRGGSIRDGEWDLG